MPNGTPGDHPYTDMVAHGKHPFPPDIESMLWKLREMDHSFIDQFGWEPFRWEKGENLDDARMKLRLLMEKHGLK
jgi:hypothetical protein